MVNFFFDKHRGNLMEKERLFKIIVLGQSDIHTKNKKKKL